MTPRSSGIAADGSRVRQIPHRQDIEWFAVVSPLSRQFWKQSEDGVADSYSEAHHGSGTWLRERSERFAFNSETGTIPLVDLIVGHRGLCVANPRGSPFA